MVRSYARVLENRVGIKGLSQGGTIAIVVSGSG
ncbi:acetylxylan esterase [Haloterrigena salifodinae]|uniref:Acetylxylan esterase n=1 Tax=Haloterrigena salifodinae TaxID=2675099 RepID=A0A8T8E6Y6_9EURY|nr:acetylxylan esterase [Haloterrigena salifodinae]